MTRECLDPVTREWVDPDEYARRKAMRAGEAKANARLATPYVYGDIRPYASPIDGREIGGRRARRYDLESNNCRAVDPSELKRPQGRYLRPEWAKMRGGKVKEEK